ncbi:ABC transporter CbaT [Streptococcus pseudoporcinus]|uniref:ABC transporter CbaT n=1 Tax=Streptococcus pseudoporcinus TaxID=361101 RepID=A0A4U9Z870_9STRE|nr:ABC transporter CbaT [Streptococcus pseudoporcinus]
MIFSHFGSYYSLASLRELAKTTNQGTTAYGLVKVANLEGFETRAVKGDMSLFDNKNTFPFIAHVIKNRTLMHYYVVIGTNKKYIFIANPDPKIKFIKISKEQFAKEWTGVSIFMSPSSNYKPHIESKESLLSFIPLLRSQKGLIINIILAALLVTVINIIGSFYLQTIIDTYIPEELKTTLGIVSIGLIIVYIIQQLLQYSQVYLLLVLGQRLAIDIILSYIKHIFKLPMSFFATRRTGEIISRFNDANSIINALASTMLSVFLDASIVLIVSVILFYQNIQLFLIALLSLPVYFILIYVFMKPFELMSSDTMEANAKLSSSIIEDINGIETIKSLTSERQRYQKIDKEFVNYLTKSFTYGKTEIIQKSLKKVAQLIINVVILGMGSSLVIRNQLSVGQLITFNALLVYFTTPLENLVNLQTKLQTARVANNRLKRQHFSVQHL